MAEASEILSTLQKLAAGQSASVTRFDTSLVRTAWLQAVRRRREARRAARRAAQDLGGTPEIEYENDPLDCSYIEQLWTDHIIVRLDDSPQVIRVPYTVEAPGTTVDHVKFGTPENVRIAYVAATALTSFRDMAPSPDVSSIVELAQRRVKTNEGARRYRKPIGAPLGDGTTGQVGAAVGKEATNRPDSLRKSIKELAARDKTYRGGKVFGDIGSEGKLKNALSKVENLTGVKQGQAAAEIVLAAQALGLTRLVPANVKRLYRAYLSQTPTKKAGDAPVKKLEEKK